VSLGGSSKSSQSSSNTDARISGGDGSINLSASSNNRIRVTDHGAVAGALELAKAGVEQANANAREATAAQGSILEGSLKMAGEQQQAFTQAVENLKGSDVRVLVVAGLAVVGVTAATILRKRA